MKCNYFQVSILVSSTFFFLKKTASSCERRLLTQGKHSGLGACQGSRSVSTALPHTGSDFWGPGLDWTNLAPPYPVLEGHGAELPEAAVAFVDGAQRLQLHLRGGQSTALPTSTPPSPFLLLLPTPASG